MDSTTVRAHQHAAGARKKTGRKPSGRSRGGLSSKLHLSCDAHGRPRQLALTGGQAGDCPQAPALLAPDLRAGQRVLADRAYDADYVRQQIERAGAQAVIPSRKNRKQVLDHDRELYKHRNQIERCINRFSLLGACHVSRHFDAALIVYTP